MHRRHEDSDPVGRTPAGTSHQVRRHPGASQTGCRQVSGTLIAVLLIAVFAIVAAIASAIRGSALTTSATNTLKSTASTEAPMVTIAVNAHLQATRSLDARSTPTVRPVVARLAADQVPITVTDVATGMSRANNTPLPLHCSTPAGKLLTIIIQSKVLDTALPVNVYLPPCYDGNRYAYPTLYLIEGLGYIMGQWVNDGVVRVASQQISAGQLPPFIIVMPANDSMSGYASRFVYTSEGPDSWEGFIVNELVPTIDARYSTWRNRDGRAIGGISRGGYWSLEIAFKHPNLFSAVGGHSPAITSEYLVGTKSGFNMLDLVRSTSALKTLRIFLDAGTNDVTLDGVYQLAAALGTNHIAYTDRIANGKHDDVYWSSQMPYYLAFYAATWPFTPRQK